MDDLSVFPYYYPTTVALIDDNPIFLQSLSLQLHDDLAYQLFTRPMDAVQRVNRPRTERPLYQRVFRREHADDAGDRVIHLDLNLIEREISNPCRFEDISVVVVDYDMPAMDGLECCHAIKDERVKKILFTGVADEKVAVRAFNEGAIDRFIIKSQGNAVTIVNQTIEELQRAYFREISGTLTSTLMLDPPGFLTDPAFLQRFHELMRAHAVVEYYLVADPPGFLMLTADGEISRLIVMDREALDRQRLLAESQGAPAEVLARLANRSALPYFFESADSFYEQSGYDWSEYLFEASRLPGARDWYYAIMEAPPVDVDYDAQSATYSAYLDRLDQAGSEPG